MKRSVKEGAGNQLSSALYKIPGSLFKRERELRFLPRLRSASLKPTPEITLLATAAAAANVSPGLAWQHHSEAKVEACSGRCLL